MEIKDRKNLLRQRMRLQRKLLSSEDRHEKETMIVQQCHEIINNYSQSGNFIAAYRSLPAELNIDKLFLNYSFNWLFPRVEGDDLLFYHVRNEKDFEMGTYGILEPRKTLTCVSLENCHLIFIPGLAFDRRGRRLGMGKGYYDRALALFKGLKVGVAFECQLTEEELPHEPHDIYMDFIITEKYTFSPIHWKRIS